MLKLQAPSHVNTRDSKINSFRFPKACIQSQKAHQWAREPDNPNNLFEKNLAAKSPHDKSFRRKTSMTLSNNR